MNSPSSIYETARARAMNALNNARPVPMVVGRETHFGSGEIDYTKPTEFVEDGVCGFAWVVIRPATSKFARWMKSQGLARTGYGGGLHMWVSEGGQSLQRKEAYAYAFAGVLREAGINAYADSRMD
jgi:hypothetical protein